MCSDRNSVNPEFAYWLMIYLTDKKVCLNLTVLVQHRSSTNLVPRTYPCELGKKLLFGS